jgi:hypothetical protein
MKYVAASKGPHSEGPLIAMQQDVEKMVVTREAALPVEYGVKGKELMDALKKGARLFIRAMELQGLDLIPLPDGNPQVVTNADGTPYGTYSITRDLGRAAPDELIDAQTNGEGRETLKQPMSLNDSYGMVDYRIVGVFWAPKVSVEIAVRRDKILAAEKAAKNPTTWGYGKATPDKPSISR